MDIALAIDKLVPAAVYSGSVTSNTEEDYEALLWLDPRPQPTWEELLTANNPTYKEELLALNMAYQASVDSFNRAFGLTYLADGPTQEAKQNTIRAQYVARKDQYTSDVAALKTKHGV